MKNSNFASFLCISSSRSNLSPRSVMFYEISIKFHVVWHPYRCNLRTLFFQIYYYRGSRKPVRSHEDNHFWTNVVKQIISLLLPAFDRRLNEPDQPINKDFRKIAGTLMYIERDSGFTGHLSPHPYSIKNWKIVGDPLDRLTEKGCLELEKCNSSAIYN